MVWRLPSKYQEIKESGDTEYEFSEAPINTLGYAYMAKDIKTALAIFKLNVEAYQNSFNVYDSYGEALMKDGQTDLAISNYLKSVEMNPGNENGIQMLKKMGIELESTNTAISEDILANYIGTYELIPGFQIEVTIDQDKIFGQVIGQPQFELFSKNETEFYLKVVDAQIVFSNNDEGEVDTLTLYQGGKVMPGKKLK
jgi:tetratricopeptide (TPR) repeat protein